MSIDLKKNAGLIAVGGVAVLAIGWFIADSAATDKFEEHLEGQLAMARMVADISYDDVDASIFGAKCIEDLRIEIKDGPNKGEVYEIGEVVIKGYDYSTAPESLSVSLKDVEMSLSSNSQMGIQLLSLGYELDAVEADYAFSYDFDDEEKTLDASFSMEMDDIGSLRASIELSGVNPMAVMGAAMGGNTPEVAIAGLDIEFKDDGITERLQERAAGYANQDVDDMIDAEIAQLEQAIANHEQNGNELMAQTMSAYRDFIEDPSRIAFSAHPDEPVKLSEIFSNRYGADTNAILTKLKPQVTAD